MIRFLLFLSLFTVTFYLRASNGSQLFPNEPVAAYVIDFYIDNPTSRKLISEVVEDYADSLGFKYKREKDGRKFTLRTDRGIFRGEFFRGQLSFSTTDIMGEKALNKVNKFVEQEPLWSTLIARNRFVHEIAPITLYASPERSENGIEIYVSVGKYSSRKSLISEFANYDSFTVDEDLVQFPEHGFIVGSCDNKKMVLYGNALYFGEVKNGLPHDLSGESYLFYFSKSHQKKFYDLILEKSLCGDPSQFRLVLDDYSNNGVYFILKGSFKNGGPYLSHTILKDGAEYTFTNTDDDTINSNKKVYHAYSSLGDMLFNSGSIEQVIFNNTIAYGLNSNEFLDYRESFETMLPVEQEIVLLDYKWYEGLPLKKNIRKYSAKSSAGANRFSMVLSLFDDEDLDVRKKSSDETKSNLIIEKGESDYLEFLGESSCANVLEKLSQNGFFFTVDKLSQSIIIDFKKSRDDSELYAILRFRGNELVKIHFDWNKRYLADVYESFQKSSNGDYSDFCVDDWFASNYATFASAVQKVPPLYVTDKTIDLTKGVCLVNCNESNGTQLIHYKFAIYEGPVKDGVPHDPNNKGRFKYLKDTSEVYSQYDRYDGVSLKDYFEIDGYGYADASNFNASASTAVLKVYLSTINSMVFLPISINQGKIIPTAEANKFYSSKNITRENLVYSGGLNDKLQPHGQGLLRWKPKEHLTEVYAIGEFENGIIRQSGLRLIYGPREFTEISSFSINKDGTYNLEADNAEVLMYDDGNLKYKTIGKWVQLNEPEEEHVIYQRVGEAYKQIGWAEFDRFSHGQLRGLPIFGVPSANKFYGINDETKNLTIIEPRTFKSYEAFYIMPFSTRKEYKNPIPIAGQKGSAIVSFDKSKMTYIEHSKGSGTVFFGNRSETEEVVITVSLVKEEGNNVKVTVLEEVTVPPQKFGQVGMQISTDMVLRASRSDVPMTYKFVPNLESMQAWGGFKPQTYSQMIEESQPKNSKLMQALFDYHERSYGNMFIQNPTSRTCSYRVLGDNYSSGTIGPGETISVNIENTVGVKVESECALSYGSKN